MRPFHRSCSGCRGSLPGLEAVSAAGGVKIIDRLAVGAVLAMQFGRAQTVQYADELGFIRV
jgi:hypothetical protein